MEDGVVLTVLLVTLVDVVEHLVQKAATVKALEVELLVKDMLVVTELIIRELVAAAAVAVLELLVLTDQVKMAVLAVLEYHLV